MTSVAICVATCKRPESLARLLYSLFQQKLILIYPQVVINIVDNDCARSGFPVVNKLRQESPWPIHYYYEERMGIPFVRNTLIDLSEGNDFIAFIDDDETASPAWLESLLYTQLKYNSDVVMGPVSPIFDAQPPPWILNGRFHFSADFAEGVTNSELITWNVLLRNSMLLDFCLRFNEKLAHTGGSDVFLGRLLKKNGITFHWSPSAIVFEHISSVRLSIWWILQRRFRGGQIFFLLDSTFESRPMALILPKTCFLLLLRSFYKLTSSPFTGFDSMITSFALLFQAAGYVSAALGYKYEEYLHVHK